MLKQEFCRIHDHMYIEDHLFRGFKSTGHNDLKFLKSISKVCRAFSADYGASNRSPTQAIGKIAKISINI